jgi:PleD family two-component response regulator
MSVNESTSPRHILVVEDDPNTADMLTSYFSSLGYSVSHAAWGHDALQIAAESLPDIVVLDIHLPDIDGYEVCMRLRSQRRTEQIPIIFLTERRDRMDRLTGLELGAVDYITKPFDVQELRYRVRNILHRNNTDMLLHPVTGLPTSNLIKEQVNRVKDDPAVALIGLELRGMEDFSNAYGFVTHDDVLRAVVLILRNTSSEMMGQDVFIGQLDTYKFMVVVPESQRYAVIGRLHQRLSEAISFFYPNQDWESGFRSDGSPRPEIKLQIGYMTTRQIPNEVSIKKLSDTLFTQVEA